MLKFLTEKENRSKHVRRGLEILMVLVLALYPLRHIHIGLDLWDNGYNYANFEFMGMESMDPMWLFSTYLATALGHILTLLPFGKTILGLNFYTGLSISLLAVTGYIFFTKKLKYPEVPVFIGEFIAINLCWCPTSLLYNYLTYFFMTVSVIHLYLGLTQGKKRFLYIAGIALGLNVFVRFSNLPEAGYIVAVWAYGILELIAGLKDKTTVIQRRRERLEFFKRTLIRTLWCILGYATSVLGMMFYIGVRYGVDEYVNGIKRLWSMGQSNSGYSPKGMIVTLFSAYRYNIRWLFFMGVAIAIGIIIVFGGKMLDAKLGIKAEPGIIFVKKFTFTGLAQFISILIGAGLCFVFCRFGFGQGEYYKFGYGSLDSYSSIMVPAIVFCFTILLWSLGVIFHPSDTINEKLLAGLSILTILITPIGSNNGQLTTLCNLFLVLPWFAWRMYKLLKRVEPVALNIKVYLREHKDQKTSEKVLTIARSYLSYFPLKAIFVLVIGLCCVRFIAFGWLFTFEQARNAVDPKYEILGDATFYSIRMSAEKADNMSGLINYLDKKGLREDRELITYGYIPALSFYLHMPSAFNPWMDLSSYSVDVMDEEIVALCDNAQNKLYEGNLPLIITSVEYAKYADGINDEEDFKEITDRKFYLIMNLIEAGDYKLKYKNDLFAVFVDGRSR
jgi:hypothetical protein